MGDTSSSVGDTGHSGDDNHLKYFPRDRVLENHKEAYRRTGNYEPHKHHDAVISFDGHSPEACFNAPSYHNGTVRTGDIDTTSLISRLRTFPEDVHPIE